MAETIITNSSQGTTVENTRTLQKKATIFRTYQVIWYLLSVVEVLLAMRLLLRLLGANPASPFASFVYAISYPFAFPFLGLFRSPAAAGSVLEGSTLIAMLVYWLLAWGLIKLMQLAKPATAQEVVNKVDDPSVQL